MPADEADRSQQERVHDPRTVKSGCQHLGGCGCDVPYHLRESTPAEQRFEARAFAPPQIEECE
jgi:hypothetical protein